MRERRLLWLFALIGATIHCVCWADLTLVKDGKSLASIIIDAEKPTRSAQLAAYELQHVVKLITGAELPIVKKTGDVRSVSILIGESDITRKLKVPSGDLKGEEYLIKFVGNQIVLIGNDSPDYGKVDYADHKTFPTIEYNYRSTTFAVYDFLEKCCGVRFYSFGDDGTALEKRATLTVKPISLRYSPKMDAFRRPYFEGKTDQIPPRDLQLLLLRWRVNTIFGEANHNVYSIYWRYWDKAVSPNLAKLFIEKRPEFFAQGYAGRFAPSAIRQQYPKDPDLPPQLCTSHQGPVDYFADEALKVYQGEQVAGGYGNHVLRMPGKPWYYPIQEDDSSEWCKCAKCQNCFSDLEPDRRYNYIHFDWVNRIAIAAAKRNPAIGISTLAYSDTLAYPDPKVLKLQPNVAVQLCLGIQSWYHPGIYSRQHGIYKNWVENEISKRPLFVWVYMLCPAHEAQLIYKYNQFFPVLYPWQTGRYFKEFARDGVRGFFAEIRFPYHLLEAYVANRVCFDPTIDTEKLIDEYFTMYYGHAAEPMRLFYRRIEDITWNINNYPLNTLRAFPKNSFTYGIHTEKVNWHLGTPERISELQKIIDEAGKQATTPLEKQRVQWFIDNIWSQAVAGRKAFETREKVRAVSVPRLTVDYAGECDGSLEKVDFNEAAKSGGWTTLNGDALETKPDLSFASDSKYFYLKYHEIGDIALQHQNAGLWTNNVEIFLAAQPDYPYGQLAIAPNGEVKALRHVIIEGVVKMEDWTIKPVITNHLDKDGWTFVMTIPLKQLLPDRTVAPGGKIYANFMRTRLFEGGTSWAWSPVFAEGYAQSLHRMGEIFIAPLTQEGPLPVNGDFKPGSDTMPNGWVLNQGDAFKPYGKITSDNSHLNIISNGKRVDLYHRQIFPARRGDQIVFEFIAHGKGSGVVGAYFYGGEGDGAGSRWNPFAVTSEPQKFKITLTVANTHPTRFTNGFRPVLATTPDSQVEYSQLKVHVIPRGK